MEQVPFSLHHDAVAADELGFRGGLFVEGDRLQTSSGSTLFGSELEKQLDSLLVDTGSLAENELNLKALLAGQPDPGVDDGLSTSEVAFDPSAVFDPSQLQSFLSVMRDFNDGLERGGLSAELASRLSDEFQQFGFGNPTQQP